jgi:hypothetical protein
MRDAFSEKLNWAEPAITNQGLCCCSVQARELSRKLAVYFLLWVQIQAVIRCAGSCIPTG